MTADDRSHQPCWRSWFIIAGRSWIDTTFLVMSLALVSSEAPAQSTRDPSSGGGSPALQRTEAAEAPYCIDLKRVVVLAMSGERFASITGKPLAGSFAETTLTLPGWNKCALYGPSAYTCDSPALATAEATERAQTALLREIKACLGEGWAEVAERSSSRYVVLHSALRPVSITLSTDEADGGTHVVHLIVFTRRN